jgi:hypothetical protein
VSLRNYFGNSLRDDDPYPVGPQTFKKGRARRMTKLFADLIMTCVGIAIIAILILMGMPLFWTVGVVAACLFVILIIA